MTPREKRNKRQSMNNLISGRTIGFGISAPNLMAMYPEETEEVRRRLMEDL